MQIKIEKYMIPHQSTNTEPSKGELTLKAEGTVEELEWLMKQLQKIG